MSPYHPELLETPVPRYTSYPTAADFGELPTTALSHAVEGASGDISLYRLKGKGASLVHNPPPPQAQTCNDFFNRIGLSADDPQSRTEHACLNVDHKSKG